jgi:hypothetical protein
MERILNTSSLKRAVIIAAVFVLSVPAFAQLGGTPGAFSRMGFGARGISMGNALTSVTTGDVIGYYNPAVSSFQNEHLINVSYSFLSFDRSLNFVSYTKNFKLPNQKEGGAGITFSWINAGVSKIDGRDADGFPIGDLSVSENQLTFAPSIRMSDLISFGIGFKFYYSKLYDGIKSTSLGFDIGAIFKASEKLNIGVTIKDINSKYTWNTQSIYGQNGSTTTDKFPVLMTIGASYQLPKSFGLISADFQHSSQTVKPDSVEYKTNSNILRMGAEISIMKILALRAGFDNLDLSATDKFGGTKLTFGLGYQKELKSYILGLNYSFVMEPYSNKPLQTITAVFKIK